MRQRGIVAPGTLVFESRRFQVRRQEVRTAGGVHVYDIVTHPGAAVILPLLPDDQILLIHNYRPAVGRELLELPAGTLDLPESPRDCALRELAEETGYQAGRLEPLCSFHSSPGFCTELLHVFVATELKPGPTRHEASEQIRLTPMKYAEALAAIGGGQIADGKTIAALLFYDRFMRG